MLPHDGISEFQVLFRAARPGSNLEFLLLPYAWSWTVLVPPNALTWIETPKQSQVRWPRGTKHHTQGPRLTALGGSETQPLSPVFSSTKCHLYAGNKKTWGGSWEKDIWNLVFSRTREWSKNIALPLSVEIVSPVIFSPQQQHQVPTISAFYLHVLPQTSTHTVVIL